MPGDSSVRPRSRVHCRRCSGVSLWGTRTMITGAQLSEPSALVPPEPPPPTRHTRARPPRSAKAPRQPPTGLGMSPGLFGGGSARFTLLLLALLGGALSAADPPAAHGSRFPGVLLRLVALNGRRLVAGWPPPPAIRGRFSGLGAGRVLAGRSHFTLHCEYARHALAVPSRGRRSRRAYLSRAGAP